MKLSTRIKRDVHPAILWDPYSGRYGEDEIDRDIVLMIDCKVSHTTRFLSMADMLHNAILQEGCKLLPQECPVVNQNEIVIHYTSTNYRDWCN